MRVLEQRELGEATLERKIPGAKKILKALEKKGYVAQEQELTERDPLRAPAARLRVEFLTREQGASAGPLPDGRGSETEIAAREKGAKLPKAQRELLAYLELHPGTHNLEAVGPHW